jgi:hypothetical protein
VPKSRSQEVKKLVERLKEEGKKEYLWRRMTCKSVSSI